MMKEKILLISAIIFIVAATIGVYFWQWSKERNDEKIVRAVVENFGLSLKNVSLLSPTAAQDIEQNYKDYLAPELLANWKADPSKALGRLTSSPWPDRIEIVKIRQFSVKGYDVSGNIIEITSLEQTQGGVAVKRPIDLKVEKINNNFLITRVNSGFHDNETADNETANWKTFFDSSQGISFQYPETLLAKYIIAQQWPPEIEVKIAQFLCASPLKNINGRDYCIGSESEGVAGGVYTTYTYSTMKNDRMVSIRFILLYPQCANYDEPQKSECENERQTFDLDGLVDKIAQTVQF